MDGREVLAQIKRDNSLKSIPTVILTISDAEVDILKGYHLQAILPKQACRVGRLRGPYQECQQLLAEQGQIAGAGRNRVKDCMWDCRRLPSSLGELAAAPVLRGSRPCSPSVS